MSPGLSGPPSTEPSRRAAGSRCPRAAQGAAGGGAASGGPAPAPHRPALRRGQAGLLGRSLWGDIPFPPGPRKALASSGLGPSLFSGCGLPPPRLAVGGLRASGGPGPPPGQVAGRAEGGTAPAPRTLLSAGTAWCAQRAWAGRPPCRRGEAGDPGRDSSVAPPVGGEGFTVAAGHSAPWAAGRWARGSGGANIPLLSAQRAPGHLSAPPPSPGCKHTRAVSSACSLDPWLSLH